MFSRARENISSELLVASSEENIIKTPLFTSYSPLATSYRPGQ